MFLISSRDERHARLAKKARPHEHEDRDEDAEEEEDLNDSNYDEVGVLCMYIIILQSCNTAVKFLILHLVFMFWVAQS